MPQSPALFLSYSHRDEDWKDRILPHLEVLARERRFRIWNDRSIAGGEAWEAEIREALEEASVGLLLVSAHFLTSDFIRREEVARLLSRRAAEGLRLYPVIVRDCPWRSVEWLRRLNARPVDGKPLESFPEGQVNTEISKIAGEVAHLLQSNGHAGRRDPETDRSGGRPRPSRLRAFDTPFIGRQRELDEVSSLFLDEGCRLVTVAGAGGVGKTRFANEVAQRAAEAFEGGCRFVDLQEQRTLVGLCTTVAEALGLDLAGAGQPQKIIADMLAQHPAMLLLLDNFEQLVDHAEETVGLWLQTAPELRLLVTSRADLKLEAQRLYPLRTLPAPPAGDLEVIPPDDESLEELRANDAVRLFLHHASTGPRKLELDATNAAHVVTVCRALDCHPLALVLVARQVNRFFTLEELVEELEEELSLDIGDDRLEQTLRRSYDMLDEQERSVFAQVCAFEGGFTRSAAKAVLRLEDGVRSREVLRVVQRLSEQSLLTTQPVHDQTRFEMYKLIQDFGRRLWPEWGGSHGPPPDLAERWARYFVEYAERWERRIRTPDAREALDRMVVERENILAAHRWALEAGKTDLAARAILAFTEPLRIRGPWPWRIPRLRETLEALGEELPAERIRLLLALSEAYWAVGEWPEADRCAEEAWTLASSHGDRGLHAHALRTQAIRTAYRGETSEALRWYEESLEAYRQEGDQWGIAYVQRGIASSLDDLGRYGEALEVIERSEETGREVGDPILLAIIVNSKGLLLWHSGRPSRSLPLFQEAEAINREVGDSRWVAGHITNQGLALTDLDRLDEALDCFDRAGVIHRRQGNKAWAAVNEGGRGRALLFQGALAEASRTVVETIQAAQEVGYTQDVAFQAGTLGRVHLATGELDRAAGELERAIELQRQISRGADRRFCGNLIALARVEARRGRRDAARRLAGEARELASRLGLGEDDEVRVVREEMVALRELEAGLRGDEEAGDAVESSA